MLHINIICIGKIKESYLKDAINEYSKRLSKYCSLNIIELADKPIPDKSNETIDMQIKQAESNDIINHISKDSYKICLDLTGKQYNSEEFSKKLEDISQFNSNISIVIGGSLGMSDEFKNSVNEKICFSKMTFPHQLFRVFLLEQLYRTFKINNNEKYHK